MMEVKSVEWFDDRFYKIKLGDGKIDYIPSVTTKLGALAKPFLIRWYGDLGTREANRQKIEKADRGTRIHHAWWVYTTNGAVIYQPDNHPIYNKDELSEVCKKYGNHVSIIRNQDEMYQVTKLQKFYKAINPTETNSEVTVCDPEMRDAGTTDNIFNISSGEYMVNGAKPLVLTGGKYIFDLKTGTAVGKEARMQVACYAKIVEKMDMGPIVGGLIGHTQAKTKNGIAGFSTIHMTQEELAIEYSDYRDVAKVWERNFGNTKPRVRTLPSIIVITDQTKSNPN